MGYYGQSDGSYQTTSKLTTTFGLINQFESYRSLRNWCSTIFFIFDQIDNFENFQYLK